METFARRFRRSCTPFLMSHAMQSLWMLAASFLFAVLAAAVKLGSPEVGTFSMIFYRGLFGVVMLFVWARATGKTLATPYIWSHFKRSGAGTVALAMWLYAITFLPLSTGMTLNYTSPIFMAAILVVAGLMHRRPVEWKLVASVLIGFVGVVEVLQPEVNARDWWPSLIGLGSGLLSAVAYIQIKELSELKEPEWRVVFYFSFFNLVFGLAGHLLFEPADTYTLKSTSCVIAVGLSACFAQVAMTRSFGAGNLLVSSVLSFSGIVFAAIIGAIVWGDAITIQSALGIAIIIFAGVCASLLTKRTSRQHKVGEALVQSAREMGEK